MTDSDGRGQNRGQSISQYTGMLTVHVMTPWAPVVIRLAIAVLPGGVDLLILGSKTLRKQLNIDILGGLRAKVLGHGNLAESEHGLAAVPGASSTVTVGLRKLIVSLGAMQTIADAEEARIPVYRFNRGSGWRGNRVW